MTEMTETAFTFTIIRPDGTEQRGRAMMPAQPKLDRLYDLLCPIIGIERGHLERVRVWHNETYLDMMVDDEAALSASRLPNRRAPEIYRNNAVVHENADPATGPQIYGVAVLFDQRVWY